MRPSGRTRGRAATRARFFAREILDVLFPVTCVGCGPYTEPTAVDGDEGRRWLCEKCRTRISPAVSVCVVCGERSPRDRTCYRCLPKTALTGVISVGHYRDPVLQAAIKRLKFHGIRALARPLGDLLARRIAATGLAPAVLVPLPLHPRRERARGYNQARLLADAAGRAADLPVADLLFRHRQSPPQTSIIESPRARRENVAGAFVPRTRGARSDERLVLVDDVLTSGATMEAAAGALRERGAQEIWAAVIARG